MAEYGESVLWGVGGDDPGPIDPDTLPLSEGLRTAIKQWAVTYDRTLNDDDPPNSGFSSAEEEQAFESEGMRLWRAIQDQLGPEWAVAYLSQSDGQLHE